MIKFLLSPLVKRCRLFPRLICHNRLRTISHNSSSFFLYFVFSLTVLSIPFHSLSLLSSPFLFFPFLSFPFVSFRFLFFPFLFTSLQCLSSLFFSWFTLTFLSYLGFHSLFSWFTLTFLSYLGFHSLFLSFPIFSLPFFSSLSLSHLFYLFLHIRSYLSSPFYANFL